jgi:recombination protein RecR
MILDNLPSKLLEDAVNEFAKLPGIGRKSALRLVLFLLNKDAEDVNTFGNAIIELRKNIKHCRVCNNISDHEICPICSNNNRDYSVICVVESVRDIMAIENTHQYKGLYHVLGGIISPMDGIGPADLNINSLEKRVEKGDVNELILALSATMEGDTTNFYLYKKFNDNPVKITTLSRGVSIGDELEYTDELTLGRSILQRLPFEPSR